MDTSKVCNTGPLLREPPVTGGLLSQSASNPESVLMSCRELFSSWCTPDPFLHGPLALLSQILSTNYPIANTWWCHQMETFSALLALCAENSPVTGEFPAQSPVMRSFDVFFELHLNKQFSKQWRCWWFEMPSHPLWCHCNGMALLSQILTMNYPIANSWNCLCQIQSLIKFLKLSYSILQYHMRLNCVLMKFNIICVYIHTCWVHTTPDLAFYWWSTHVYGISLDYLTDVYWIQSH